MSNTAYGSITVTDLVDRGIAGVQGYYYVSNNTSESFNPSTWSTSILSPTSSNKYLWYYEVTTYSDGSTSNWGPLIIGTYGETGDTGVGISTVQKLLYLKNSNSSAPSAPTSAVTSTSTSANEWTTASPDWQTGYYYWTCYQTQKTDGSYSWSSVVLDSALNEANETAYAAELLANSKAQVYYSESAPPAAGDYNTGDIWVRVPANLFDPTDSTMLRRGYIHSSQARWYASAATGVSMTAVIPCAANTTYVVSMLSSEEAVAAEKAVLRIAYATNDLSGVAAGSYTTIYGPVRTTTQSTLTITTGSTATYLAVTYYVAQSMLTEEELRNSLKVRALSTNGNETYYYNGSSWVLHKIGTTTIIDGSITTDLIAAGAITTAKLDAGAVTTVKLAAGAITADKIAAGTITANELASDAITSENIDLYGEMTVYEDSTLANSGGKLGYMQGLQGYVDGVASTTDGMAISDDDKNNYLLVTDAGVRMTHVTSGATPVQYDAYLSGDRFYTTGRLVVDNNATTTPHRVGGTIRLNSMYDSTNQEYTMSGTTYLNEAYYGPNGRVYVRETANGRGALTLTGYSGCGSGIWYVDNNSVSRINLFDSGGNSCSSIGINTNGEGYLMVGNATDGVSFATKADIDAWNGWLPTILWENSSQTSAFAAQTLSLSLTNYNLFAIKFKEASNNSGSSEFFFWYGKTTGANVTTARWVSISGSSIFFNSRSLSITNSGISFNDGMRYTQGSSSSTTNNYYMVPWAIYGMAVS